MGRGNGNAWRKIEGSVWIGFRKLTVLSTYDIKLRGWHSEEASSCLIAAVFYTYGLFYRAQDLEKLKILWFELRMEESKSALRSYLFIGPVFRLF